MVCFILCEQVAVRKTFPMLLFKLERAGSGNAQAYCESLQHYLPHFWRHHLGHVRFLTRIYIKRFPYYYLLLLSFIIIATVIVIVIVIVIVLVSVIIIAISVIFIVIIIIIFIVIVVVMVMVIVMLIYFVSYYAI